MITFLAANVLRSNSKVSGPCFGRFQLHFGFGVTCISAEVAVGMFVKRREALNRGADAFGARTRPNVTLISRGVTSSLFSTP